MSDLLDEVQQDLKDERDYNVIRRLVKIFVTVAVIAILGVSIYVWKEHTTAKLQQQMGTWFNKALALSEKKQLDEAIVYFDKVIAHPHQYYAALAYLNKAAILFEQGKGEEGQKLLLKMSEQENFKIVFRELSQLIYLSNQLNGMSAESDKTNAILEKLTQNNKAWRFSALQLKALYEIKRNNFTEAKVSLNQVIDSKEASQASKNDASAILSVISKK